MVHGGLDQHCPAGMCIYCTRHQQYRAGSFFQLYKDADDEKFNCVSSWQKL